MSSLFLFIAGNNYIEVIITFLFFAINLCFYENWLIINLA